MSLRRHWPSIVVGLLLVLYLAYFGWFTLRAYDAFVYQAYDLGIYDQAVWNTAHGHLLRSTLEEPYDILLGDHFEPILLPMALIYLLWASPKVLLFIQSAGLALGVLPVYWLARDALRSASAAHRSAASGAAVPDRSPAPLLTELSALVFACAYLLYPAVHSANVFEFHPSALAIPFLLYTIYFLRKRRFILYFVFLILTMSTKEVLPLTTLALGLYAFLIEKRRWVGVWTMIASGLWFGLVVFVVIPHFSPEGQSQYFGEYYGWLGSSASEVLGRLISHPQLVWQRLVRPDGLRYINALLRPMAYVSLLGLPLLLVAVPALFLNVLSDFPFQHNALNFFQYAAAIAPFVIVAAIDGTAFLARYLGFALKRIRSSGKWLGNAQPLVAIIAASILFASLAVQRYHGYLPFSRDFYLAPRNEKVAAAQAIVNQIPAEATVSADLIFGPHLAHRQSIYVFPSLHDSEYTIVDGFYRDAPFIPRDRYDAVQALLAGGQYGVLDGRYGYLLLRQGMDQPVIPDSFYDFARAAAPAPQIKTDLVFGDELRLIGFDLAWERPVRPHAYLTLYWQALRPIDRDLRLFFILIDPASAEPLPGTELEFDASVWYPPSRWLPAEAIRADTTRWSAEDARSFGVAIGVVEGPGFWDVDKRLHPDVRSAPWPMPRVHDGALVWLATLEADGRLVTLQKPGHE